MRHHNKNKKFGREKVGAFLLLAALFMISGVSQAEANKPTYATNDRNYAESKIEQARDFVLEAEKKAAAAKKKWVVETTDDKTILEFREKIIDAIDRNLKSAPKKLKEAEQFFKDENYSASIYPVLSSMNDTQMVISLSNKVLAGKGPDDWNRLYVEPAKEQLEGVKELIIISDEEQIPEIKDKRVLVVVPLEGMVTEIKMTIGASPKDCQFYLSGCKEGDNNLCMKWETNCTAGALTQCDEFSRECKFGNSEACDKWDLNCKSSKDNKCNVLLRECKLSNEESCNAWDLSCKEITIKTKEIVEVKNEKLFLNEKEVKIMPDTASAIAIEKLKTLSFDIELKDVGGPVYEVVSKKDVKIFGLFKKQMTIKIEINGETGEVGKVKKPWWSFLVF